GHHERRQIGSVNGMYEDSHKCKLEPRDRNDNLVQAAVVQTSPARESTVERRPTLKALCSTAQGCPTVVGQPWESCSFHRGNPERVLQNSRADSTGMLCTTLSGLGCRSSTVLSQG